MQTEAVVPAGQGVFSFGDYRDWLRKEFEFRSQRNASYSLRAFARDLSLSPSRLSELFSKKTHLSQKLAESVATTLNLAKFEREHFLDLVSQSASRSPVQKIAARHRVQNRLRLESFRVSQEMFSVISEWHHFAILELSTLKNFRSDPEWIAQRLDLGVNTVKISIERMLRLGMLVKESDGKLRARDEWSLSPDTPSKALRLAHENLIHKALRALHFLPVSQRDFSNVLLTLSPEQYPFAVQAIKDFRRNLKKSLPVAEDPSRLYSLAIQFFPLDKADV